MHRASSTGWDGRQDQQPPDGESRASTGGPVSVGLCLHGTHALESHLHWGILLRRHPRLSLAEGKALTEPHCEGECASGFGFRLFVLRDFATLRALPLTPSTLFLR